MQIRSCNLLGCANVQACSNSLMSCLKSAMIRSVRRNAYPCIPLVKTKITAAWCARCNCSIASGARRAAHPPMWFPAALPKYFGSARDLLSCCEFTAAQSSEPPVWPHAVTAWPPQFPGPDPATCSTALASHRVASRPHPSDRGNLRTRARSENNRND